MSEDRVEVLQVSDFPPWTTEKLEAEFTVHKYHSAEQPAALLSRVAGGVRAVVATAPDPVDSAMIHAIPGLEIVSCFAVGVDFVDLAAAAERGVVVTNTPEVLTDCVADLAMGLLIAASRRIVEGDGYVRAGRWPREGDIGLSSALRGKTVGIVGFGRIGKQVGKRAAAFGMTVAYHGRNRQADVAEDYHASARELAAASDYLVLCCPGGPETRHMIDHEVLAALGPGGFLVNVARGSVVDTDGLIGALRDGLIGGAALDVFEAEPDVPGELLAFPGVIVQPHHASATIETRTAMGELMIENLVRHFAGRPVLTPVGR